MNQPQGRRLTNFNIANPIADADQIYVAQGGAGNGIEKAATAAQLATYVQAPIANGSANDAGPLTGNETVPMSRGTGLLQKSLNGIATWVLQTFAGFTYAITGGVARTVAAKLGDLFNAADVGASTSSTDNSSVFYSATATGKLVNISDGVYPFAEFFQSLTQPIRLRGASTYGVTLQNSSVTSMSTISNTGVNGTHIEGLSINTPNAVTATVGQIVSLIDVNDATIRDTAIGGLAGVGSAIIAYPQSNPSVKNVRLLDLKITGNLPQGSNNNGTLITGGWYCQQRGIYADSISQFGVEYKNASAYSTASDLIANNCAIGYGLGDTQTPAVQYTAASTIVAKDCASGVNFGAAFYNVAGNAVVTIQTPFPNSATKEGIRLSDGSSQNALSNFLFQGTFTDVVHILAGASYNYVSGAYHMTGGVATLESGVKGNVIAVNHPGARTTILNAVADNSGQTISGANSNPVYCHATGEYRGSLSGRWRWQHAISGYGVQNSSDKWVYESAGDSYLAVLTDGTAGAGFRVETNAKTHGLIYNWAGDYWQIDTASTNYRFYSGTFQPYTDGNVVLGGIVARWADVKAMTATLSGPIALQPPTTQPGATYSQTTSDSTLIFNGSATQTLTLLAAATYPGRILHVKNTAAFAVNSASSNVVPLAGGSAGTAILAAGPGKWATLQSDGANWIVIAGN
ncbi:hypothetical protein PI86_10985 [Burkholderia sp. A9]|uniref:hypothetical protein n=1 Tax=Burkholderia sp. A9 TaxID=1365108 RepID=UPI00057521C5|nr:hypothetical protein [Burkholderia sp. A9]KHK58130.1 hypothetical protein PI86_10985 [Burkholderia sp. A9]